MSFRKIIRIFDFSSLASDSPNYEARTLKSVDSMSESFFLLLKELKLLLNDRNTNSDLPWNSSVIFRKSSDNFQKSSENDRKYPDVRSWNLHTLCCFAYS